MSELAPPVPAAPVAEPVVKSVAPGIIEINSSTLIIGATGSGKSVLLATAYEYVWETYKRVSLHYNADPGGFPDQLRALAAYGIVRVFRMQSRGVDYSFETAALASRGFWPAQIDPKSGHSPHGVKMIPPVVTTYTEHCGHCGEQVGQSIAVDLLMRGLCPKCQKLRGNQSSKITTSLAVARGFENVGARGYDGLTSISDWYLQDMSQRKELGGEEGSIGGKISSGDITWRQNNRAQVGFAQSRVHELVINSLEIPGMVIMPLWTALSDQASDEGGLPIVGPKLAGSAKTDIAPAWFGNVFEAALETNSHGNKVRRLYLSSFVDARNRNHLLRHRGDSRLVPEVVEDQPYSATGQPPAEICTGFNLGHVFQLLDDSLEQTIAETGRRYPDAPGLDSVPSSYGMDVPQGVQQTSQQPTVSRATVRPRRGKTAAAPPPTAHAPAAPVPSGAEAPAVQEAPSPVVAAPAVAAPVVLPIPATPPATGLPMAPVAVGSQLPRPRPRPAAAIPAAVGAPVVAQGPAQPPVPAQAQAPPVVNVGQAAAPAAPGAWAQPPGGTLAAPRAPSGAPAARPVARPIARAIPKP